MNTILIKNLTHFTRNCFSKEPVSQSLEQACLLKWYCTYECLSNRPDIATGAEAPTPSSDTYALQVTQDFNICASVS